MSGNRTTGGVNEPAGSALSPPAVPMRAAWSPVRLSLVRWQVGERGSHGGPADPVDACEGDDRRAPVLERRPRLFAPGGVERGRRYGP
ncbi:hypothetical protein ACWDUI_28120 [Streptosporangium sandarakinum]|uniref:hypothetical protein n=1 Tax=Streptosporangium TaxID=2000 RepID=UPI0031F9DC50